MTQEVDVEMSSVEPSVHQEAEPEFTNEIDVEMESEWLPRTGRALAQGGALAIRWAQQNLKCYTSSQLLSSSLPFDEPENRLSPLTPPVRIHLYKDAQAWHYLREILFHRDLEGNINLLELRSELAVDGELQVGRFTSILWLWQYICYRFWNRVIVVCSLTTLLVFSTLTTSMHSWQMDFCGCLMVRLKQKDLLRCRRLIHDPRTKHVFSKRTVYCTDICVVQLTKVPCQALISFISR